MKLRIVLVAVALATRGLKLAGAFLRWLLAAATLSLLLVAGGVWSLLAGIEQLWGKSWAHVAGGVIAMVGGALLARAATRQELSDGDK